MELDAITEPNMTLSRAVGIYAAACVGCLIAAFLSVKVSWFPGVLYFVTYFLSGFVLNRVVLRQLIEWHPVYNTIDNVSRGKLTAFLFWPLSYAVLFFKLAVSRVL